MLHYLNINNKIRNLSRFGILIISDALDAELCGTRLLIHSLSQSRKKPHVIKPMLFKQDEDDLRFQQALGNGYSLVMHINFSGEDTVKKSS